MKKESKAQKDLNEIYDIELLDDNYFEDSEDIYRYYFIKDKETGRSIHEGVSLFDASFEDGIMEYLSPKEQTAYAHGYLEAHIKDLLNKRNVHTLHPYVRDLVLASANSTSGMCFIECYEQMSKEEREFYTKETLQIICDEVEKEGLSDYIEVGSLDMYEKEEDILVPSKEPVITVYMAVSTLFDLSEISEEEIKRTVNQIQKASLIEQIASAKEEKKDSISETKIIHERS